MDTLDSSPIAPDSTMSQDSIFVQSQAPIRTDLRSGPMRLETITRVRWAALLGQSIAIVTVGLFFGFTLPLYLCFVLILAGAWLNIFLSSRFERSSRLEETATLSLFAFDTLQLGGLLFFTGGLVNPFAIMMMAPVVTSSATMSLKRTAYLGGLAIVVVSFLAFFHMPLPWTAGSQLAMPLPYVGGIWLSIVISIVFITFYVFRVAGEAEALSDALAETELVFQREHHLQALDGLAAAAAHELGTPLATIALVAKELDNLVEANSPLKDDIELLRSQSQRCREILKKLTMLSTTGEEFFERLTPTELLTDVKTQLAGSEPDVLIEMDFPNALGGTDPVDEPVIHRNPGVVYGVGNILENALDFAKEKVVIGSTWDDQFLSIEISDDGPGFSSENLANFGEPYMSRRDRRNAGGLGLGLFIAKTLLERTGASLEVANIQKPNKGAAIRKSKPTILGARVTIKWPRERLNAS